MTFFEKRDPPPPPSKAGPDVKLIPEKGTASVDNYEDRMRRLWPSLYAPKPEPDVSELRVNVRSPSQEVEKSPRGCLFRIDAGLQRGFFDLDGYWYKKTVEGYAGTRGAPRFVMKMLTEAQKRELHRVRLVARRNKIR